MPLRPQAQAAAPAITEANYPTLAATTARAVTRADAAVDGGVTHAAHVCAADAIAASVVPPHSTVREVPGGSTPAKFPHPLNYPHGEGHSSPQKRARWPLVTANGVPAELGERAPAERTWSASGRLNEDPGAPRPLLRAHGPTPL